MRGWTRDTDEAHHNPDLAEEIFECGLETGLVGYCYKDDFKLNATYAGQKRQPTIAEQAKKSKDEHPRCMK